MQTIVTYLLYIAIILLPFQGVYKPEILGFLSSSPGNIFFLTSFFFLICKGINITRFKQYILFIAWPFIGSIISLILFGYNAFYFDKIIPLLAGNILWTTPMILINYIEINNLRKVLCVNYIITIIGIILFDFNLDKFEWLYNFLISPEFDFYKYQTRLSGFSTEPLQLAQNLTHISLAIYIIDLKLKENLNSKLNFNFILFFIFNVLLTYFIGSKGTFFFLIIALIFSIDIKKIFNIKFYFYLSILSFFIINAVRLFIDETINNYYLYYSFTTRIVFFITAIIAFLKNPFGYGYYGFYGALIENSNGAISFLSDKLIGGDLNLNEVYKIVDEVYNVSTKSGLADYLITHGIIIFYVLFIILKNLDLNNFYCRFSIIFILLNSLTASTNEVLITILLITIITKIFNRTNLINYKKDLILDRF